VGAEVPLRLEVGTVPPEPDSFICYDLPPEGRLKMLVRILVAMVTFFACSLSQANAKTWTVDDRQQKLMQEINKGQKSGELTQKEARMLRKQEATIARKKAKMKRKNLDRLSSEDINELEEDLNKVSVDLNKLRLEKRVSK